MAKFDKHGNQVPDQTEVEVPLRVKRLMDHGSDAAVRRIVEQVLSQRAAAAGFESLEESDDFDVDDDGELQSPYEVNEMQADQRFEREVVEPKEPPIAKPVVKPSEGSSGPSDPLSSGEKNEPQKPSAAA